jgi:hypothetical protein
MDQENSDVALRAVASEDSGSGPNHAGGSNHALDRRRPYMSDKAGWAALILALGVMVSIVIISVGAEITSTPLTTEEQTLLSTIVGAAIGAVATYIGVRRGDSE